MVKWFLLLTLISIDATAQTTDKKIKREPSSWTGNLTDATNPKKSVKSLGDCLKSIDTTGDRSPGQINLDNDKLADCIRTQPEKFMVPSEYWVCARGVARIKDNPSLKSEASFFCKDNYATTMDCVKSAAKAKDLKTKQARTRECVSKNFSHFEPQFCMKLLADAQLEKDKELKFTCTEKAERLPPSVTPAKGSGQK